MKKLLLMAVLAGFTYFGGAAQAPGNSAYGHSHKKAKKHHKVYNGTAAQRRAVNVQHKTAVRTIQQNDALTNQQQKNQIKQANVVHKQEMRTVSKPGKKK